MKLPKTDNPVYSTFVLVVTAAILTAAVLLTDRKDITSAAVVLSAMILFLAGVYIFTFSKKEPIDGRISALLPVQGSINICRIVADLGISGYSWFLPAGYTEDNTTMQYIPVSEYHGEKLTGGTFVSGKGGSGVLLPPSGETIMSELKARYSLTIPDTNEEIAVCIREIGEELLEVADQVQVTVNDESFTVRMVNFKLADGCHQIEKESPACCMIYPCPVCSLYAMVLAEGRKAPLQIERCRVIKNKPEIETIFSFLPETSVSEA